MCGSDAFYLTNNINIHKRMKFVGEQRGSLGLQKSRVIFRKPKITTKVTWGQLSPGTKNTADTKFYLLNLPAKDNIRFLKIL